jgi:hypothetical protein
MPPMMDRFGHHGIGNSWVYSQEQADAVLAMQRANARAAELHQIELAQAQAAAAAAVVIPTPPVVVPAPATPPVTTVTVPTVASPVVSVLTDLVNTVGASGVHIGDFLHGHVGGHR